MTSYEDIYESFLSKINDIDLANYSNDDLEKQLDLYLGQAISDFSDYCIKDLSDRDKDKKCFNITLDDREIDILSEFMVVRWLYPILNNLENLRNTLNTSDFSIYSPANLLEKIEQRYSSARMKARSMMNEYYLIHDTYDSWGNS